MRQKKPRIRKIRVGRYKPHPFVPVESDPLYQGCAALGLLGRMIVENIQKKYRQTVDKPEN
jgi:hypothetical protein